MKILFFCPRWGCEAEPWNQFLTRVKDAGYDGVETGYPFTLPETEKREIVSGLKHHGLAVIGQHWQTIEKDFEEHKQVFKKHLYALAELKPVFINSQTGKDYFTIEQNLALIKLADEVSSETGIKIVHETHRGKWSFAAHITQQYLKIAPHIRITLDLSHWCNVAESLLDDQPEAVDLAIQHTDHLHARVGFQEGPQVIDPRAPANDFILNAHLNWWDKLVALKSEQQDEMFTITPEFGAPPYQHLFPYTNEPITNQWEVNVWMKDLLKSRYTIKEL
jgi:sugar phosphate isomerase/epimerase